MSLITSPARVSQGDIRLLLHVRVANTVCLPTLQPDRVLVPVSRACVHAFGLANTGRWTGFCFNSGWFGGWGRLVR